MNRAILITALLIATSGFGQDAPGRETLLGSWHAEPAGSAESWTLKSDGSVLTLTRSENGVPNLQAECKTNGSECEGKVDNRKAKFSIYFNGSAMVVLETRDSGVIKRLFSVGATGDVMTVEVTPITGPGKHETIHLTRVQRA